MMNRRWFFSTAGSAFLTAACGVVRGGARDLGEALPVDVPRTPDEHFASLLDWFFVGLEDQVREMQKLPEQELPAHQLPRRREQLVALFEGPLTAIYRKRFDYRVAQNDLPLDKLKLRRDQACVLGQLTGLAFAYESGRMKDPRSHSFEMPDATPALGVKHLEWARDTYGIYTNDKVGKRREINLCGEPGGPGKPGRQINEPCPFCHA